MKKHHLPLSEHNRQPLESLVRQGTFAARVFTHATGLLELDRGKTLQAVAETLGGQLQYRRRLARSVLSICSLVS